MTRKEVLSCLGLSPDQVGEELATFTVSAEALSSDHPRFIDAYPCEWVGVFNGSVAARGTEEKDVISELESKGIPISKTIVRFIDNREKIFIL
jgi:hypothetical protein